MGHKSERLRNESAGNLLEQFRVIRNLLLVIGNGKGRQKAERVQLGNNSKPVFENQAVFIFGIVAIFEAIAVDTLRVHIFFVKF